MTKSTMNHLSKDSNVDLIDAVAQIASEKIIEFQNQEKDASSSKEAISSREPNAEDKIMREMEEVNRSLDDTKKK